MKDEEENIEPDMPGMEPEPKRFTDKELVKGIVILFVFAIYFFIFLKILFLD